MVIIKKILLKFFKKNISNMQLKNVGKSRDAVRIIIGSGYTFYTNWILTDIETLNIIIKSNWEKYFKPNTISSVLAEHVFEHLQETDFDLALENIYHFLKVGGNLRIAVPDGFQVSQDYISSVKPGGTGNGSHDHKFLYNYLSLSTKLEKYGFKVNLIEYFDENGKFHLTPWNDVDGKIRRSALNDTRNFDGNLNYTSLIIDAIK
jgi:predicted SAM-dependent methyltransferase